VVLELHLAADLGEQRVVLAEADVEPRPEPAPALAHRDRSAGDEVAVVFLTPSRCELLSRPLREEP
jgi:hypothetical protein